MSLNHAYNVRESTVHDRGEARTTSFSAISRALGSRTFKAAPRLNPPIPTGMTDVAIKLRAFLSQRLESATSQEEYRRVPDLLRRLRHLLRVYFDAKVTGRKPVEFKYCDIEDPFATALDLYRCGNNLRLAPGRLRALFRYAPQMDNFLFEEPLDIGIWHTEWFFLQNAIAEDAESSGDDEAVAEELGDAAKEDLAARSMMYIIGNMLVGWIFITPSNNTEQRRAERALGRLAEYGSSPIYRKTQVLGGALTDVMRPVCDSPEVLLRFALAGGLPMLFSDWATSLAGKPGGYIHGAIESLPATAWKNQTDETLLGVMEGIVKKVDEDEDEDEHRARLMTIDSKLLAKIIHRIFLRYGVRPFERASTTISSDCTLFIFLYRRLAREPSVYRSFKELRALLGRYASPRLPKASRDRHSWLAYNVTDRWENIEDFGCKNVKCPEKAELLELRAQRQRGVRDPAIEERLCKWGAESKACHGCKEVTYCSRDCQKAHYLDHKPVCKKERDMEHDV